VDAGAPRHGHPQLRVGRAARERRDLRGHPHCDGSGRRPALRSDPVRQTGRVRLGSELGPRPLRPTAQRSVERRHGDVRHPRYARRLSARAQRRARDVSCSTPARGRWATSSARGSNRCSGRFAPRQEQAVPIDPKRSEHQPNRQVEHLRLLSPAHVRPNLVSAPNHDHDHIGAFIHRTGTTSRRGAALRGRRSAA
jgi:hypothetical protein